MAADIANRLRKILKTILHCYRKEVRAKREVVFLPYKASMWDSLESVWKKYDADPEWEARVIPITFYKNYDMSIAINTDRDKVELPNIIRNK